MSGQRRFVELAGVAHWFRGTDILFSGLSTVFHEGSLTAVCGPSGCGKSTLLTLIAGWERPRRGAIAMHGVASMAWVFQNPHGVARRSAVDHVAFPLLAQGASRARATTAARNLMSRFELDDVADQEFRTLSGGEAQRLMLARALAASPDVLLVDEPTAQLDRRSAATVNRCLTQLAGRGVIVVVATHDPDTRAACAATVDLAAGGAERG